MDRRAPIAVLTGLIVAVLFAAIATSGPVQVFEGAPSFARDPTPPAPPATVAPVEVEAVDQGVRTPLELPSFVETIARLVFFACLAVFTLAAIVFVWRHRPSFRLRRAPHRSTTEIDPLDDVATAITADADAQRAALQRGAPRNAIVECWLLLEQAVVDAGVPRNPADTSAEFTARVLAAASVDRTAITDLAALYREARFSDHVMDEDSRRRAIEALDAVHDQLRAARRTNVGTT